MSKTVAKSKGNTDRKESKQTLLHILKVLDSAALQQSSIWKDLIGMESWRSMNTGEAIFTHSSEIITEQHKSNLIGIHLVIFTAQMLFLAHYIIELGT